MPGETIALSNPIGDTVKATTCYMCACRCGIHVHLKDGRVRYIEGNPDHPVNRGVLCGKGSAGIMQHYSPARLRSPLIRVGERGEGRFREIGWDEALDIATGWLARIRATDPRRLAFFTGRDQSQALTGFWAKEFGTPNFAAHGGFCSVNMGAAGLYSVGGSFWEFGEPDWEHARLFLLFGVAEDHDSNPIKIGLSRLKARGARIISINPVRTGYSAVADEWVGLRPGTDGLFILSIIHLLLAAERVDLDFLSRYTNGGWLVVRDPGGAGDGLFARDAEGRVLIQDRASRELVEAGRPGTAPRLAGEVRLADGKTALPVFQLLAERYLDPAYAPEAVAARCGITAETIRRIAAEIAEAASATITLPHAWTDSEGVRHAEMHGRPVAMHAMRGISAHSNGFQTCRALHVLQMLIGAVDTPGSWRYKAPYPRPTPPHAPPGGKDVRPETPLSAMPLGMPSGPEDLLVDREGAPQRIDHAFSWEAPLGLHGLMHTVIANAHAGDPYPIDTLFLYMANMAWNSSPEPMETARLLTDKDERTGEYRIPHLIYADAYFSETVAYADLVLPDTTYLERFDCISILDRPIGSAEGPADAIRQPVVAPDRDVRPFQDVLIDLGGRLGLPAFVKPDGTARYASYADYIVHHERRPGIGPLAGWRGNGTQSGRGAPNPSQLEHYIANGCFWRHELPPEAHYFKFANRDYLEAATALGLIEKPERITLQLYAEPLQRFRLAGLGHGDILPPPDLRERVARYCDPLPFWYPPFEQEAADEAEFPLSAITQRPMPMYHSWGSQNAWLRQIHARNFLYIAPGTARALGLEDGEWVKVSSRSGSVTCPVRIMEGVNPLTVWTWNAIGKRAGAWMLAPDAPESRQGFLLNHVIATFLPRRNGRRLPSSDPVTGQAAWYDARVRIEKAARDTAGTLPHPPDLRPPEGLLAAMKRARA
ncbi:MAG TPA: molybdopterin-dependent oxidoreductase [Acetobacteraceae bacterium]|nr:molybdopterin-dependent oxidoreductase [Acetobacteraceae bacterium]